MENKFYQIYDAIIAEYPAGLQPLDFSVGGGWALCETECSSGIAMYTNGQSRPPLCQDFPNIEAIKSWNMHEASMAMALANSGLNTVERMEKLHCAEPFENYCTAGLDFKGKAVVAVGHLHLTEEIWREAKSVQILERDPKPGDYPDSACEVLLPRCDIAIISGSAFTNKTMPRLLELTSQAYTIVTGPSTPMCPELLDLGIDRLAGLVLTDRSAMARRVRENLYGSPYPWGQSWLLKR